MEKSAEECGRGAGYAGAEELHHVRLDRFPQVRRHYFPSENAIHYYFLLFFNYYY